MYSTHLTHTLTEKCTKMHMHTLTVAALIIYGRPTLLTLTGKKTTEQGKKIIEEEKTNERVKERGVGENEAASRWCFLI